MDIPSKHTLIYKDCDEPWCFSFISSPKQKGAATTVLKGCESRSLLKHRQTKMMDQEYSNNTDWMWSEAFFNAPRCSEIIAVGTEALAKDGGVVSDGVERVCLDISFEQKNVGTKGKICCCRGQDHCNEDIKWSDLAIQMADVEEYRRRKNLSSKASATGNIFNPIFAAIFVCAFFKF
uniref:Uncharacterized protein n=1 Tax=Panagrolaimus sp. JU765 TaxID=591449 RepID=A0AC34QAD3_9BILA